MVCQVVKHVCWILEDMELKKSGGPWCSVSPVQVVRWEALWIGPGLHSLSVESSPGVARGRLAVQTGHPVRDGFVIGPRGCTWSPRGGCLEVHLRA